MRRRELKQKRDCSERALVQPCCLKLPPFLPSSFPSHSSAVSLSLSLSLSLSPPLFFSSLLSQALMLSASLTHTHTQSQTPHPSSATIPSTWQCKRQGLSFIFWPHPKREHIQSVFCPDPSLLMHMPIITQHLADKS